MVGIALGLDDQRDRGCASIGYWSGSIKGAHDLLFEGERAGLSEPKSPLAGFWALLVGGALLTVLTVALQPIADVRDCRNYRPPVRQRLL
ncbi:hypothetical protein ACQPZJ_15195 [Actinoplanes sp. CA-054009]